MDNICKFIPTEKSGGELHTINFVYEKENPSNILPATNSVYRINLVASGSAVVTQLNVRKQVNTGDVFFVFPAVPYTIEGDEEFSVIYVSFIGIRAGVIMERFSINPENFVFETDDGIKEFWQKNLDMSGGVMDMAAECVLLHTLAYIGNAAESENDTQPVDNGDRFLLIKKYIDENFSDHELSLEKLSKIFSYNKKYLSSAFKKHFKIGIFEYLYTVRINHACVLMERNYKSAQDLAFLCGFSDPVHFSKLFKKKMKISPREYIKQRNS